GAEDRDQYQDPYGRLSDPGAEPYPDHGAGSGGDDPVGGEQTVHHEPGRPEVGAHSGHGNDQTGQERGAHGEHALHQVDGRLPEALADELALDEPEPIAPDPEQHMT